MKRFKNTVLFVILTILIMALWPFRNLLSIEEDVHTRRFCAYGQVYVEFEHAGKTWGTTFLGVSGKPVACNENDTLSTPALHKEII